MDFSHPSQLVLRSRPNAQDTCTDDYDPLPAKRRRTDNEYDDTKFVWGQFDVAVASCGNSSVDYTGCNSYGGPFTTPTQATTSVEVTPQPTGSYLYPSQEWAYHDTSYTTESCMYNQINAWTRPSQGLPFTQETTEANVSRQSSRALQSTYGSQNESITVDLAASQSFLSPSNDDNSIYNPNQAFECEAVQLKQEPSSLNVNDEPRRVCFGMASSLIMFDSETILLIFATRSTH